MMIMKMSKDGWLHISVVLFVVYTISIFSRPLIILYPFPLLGIILLWGGYILVEILKDSDFPFFLSSFFFLWISVLSGSAFWGVRPGYSWLWILKWGMILYVSLWLFLLIIKKGEWIQEGVIAVNIVFVVISVARLIWRLSGYWRFGLSISLLLRSWRLSAFPGIHPNLSAQFLVLMTGYFIGLLSKANNKPLWRWILYAIIALYAFFLVLTVSRGGWLAWWGVLVTSFGLHAWNRRVWQKGRNFWPKQKGGLIFWVLLLVFWLLLANWRLRARFVNASSQSIASLSGREVLWQAAWDAFRQSPIVGIGYGNFPAWLAIKGISPPFPLQSHAHNIFLHIAAETGVLGLGVWFGFWIWLGYKVFRRIRTRQLVGFERGIFASLVGIWLHGMVETWFVYPNLWLIVFVFVGFLLKDEVKKITRLARLFLFFSLLVYSGMWGIKVAFPQYLSWRGVQAFQSSHWEEAENWFQAAAQYSLWPVTDLWRAGQAALLADGEQGRRSAISYYQHALLIEPWYAPRWASLALLYFTVGDVENAQANIREATARAPLDARLWWLRGWLSYRLHDVEDAQFAFAQSISLQTDFCYTADIWLHSNISIVNRGFVYDSVWYQFLLEKNIKEARVVFQRKASQGHAEGWVGLAMIAIDEEDPQKAEQYLQIAHFLETIPETTLAYAYLNQYYKNSYYLESYQQALYASSLAMLTSLHEENSLCDIAPCPGLWPPTIEIDGLENWLWMFFAVQNIPPSFARIR